MSKNRGSSFSRKARRLHVDPFSNRKLKRKNNRAGRWFYQFIHMISKDGREYIKVISHRTDHLKQSEFI
jgi:hypothetical protein